MKQVDILSKCVHGGYDIWLELRALVYCIDHPTHVGLKKGETSCTTKILRVNQS